MVYTLAILIIFCTLAVQTIRNGTPNNIINNPEQAHRCKSLHFSIHFEVVCSDLLYFKSYIMQTTQSGIKTIDLLTTQGFFKRYLQLVPTSRSSNEAFVKTSIEHFNRFQSFKFTSLTQFQNAIYGSSC